MALSRSASGPGGLSINTGSANLFSSSNTSQPPPAGGLFGGAGAQSSQPAPSGGLFGTAATSQPQSTGSLFGSTAAATSQPQQQTSSLFGNAAAAPAQPTQSTGLFGQSAAAPQPSQTGGLFGSAQAAQPQQAGGFFGSTATQPLQQRTGGLFGSTTTAQPQPQAQSTGGLFGGTQGTQQTSTGGLFGTATQQQPQQQSVQTTGGLFGGSIGGIGANMATQNRPAGSLFGSLNQPTSLPQSGAFGQPTLGPSLTMGQSTNQQQQQQQVVPGVRIDLSNIRSTTRFNDLQEDLQKGIAEIDKAIQGFMSQKAELDAFMPGHGDQVSAIPADVTFVGRKAAGVDGALAGDAVAIRQLQGLVRSDADDARLSFKAVENLKLPTAYHQAGLWSAPRGGEAGDGTGASGAKGDDNGEGGSGGSSDLVTFFSKAADDMAETMKKFERNLGEIELHLHGVQGNVLEQLQRVAATPRDGAHNGTNDKVAELAAVLRDFEESILQVAGVVGGAREGMTSLQLGEVLGRSNGLR